MRYVFIAGLNIKMRIIVLLKRNNASKFDIFYINERDILKYIIYLCC